MTSLPATSRNSNSIIISGGTVEAYGGSGQYALSGPTTNNSGGGAGIGSGANRGGVPISIDGNAVIKAEGGFGGAGIGGGYNSSYGDITIDGNADVTATGTNYGSGIGGYFYNSLSGFSGSITIDGGTVTATGGNGGGAGIGGSSSNNSVSLMINNGDVFAYGGGGGAGLGGGGSSYIGGASGIITINGGNVFAVGSSFESYNGGGAGIGGGGANDAVTGGGGPLNRVDINGGNVKAFGGNFAPGIGGGGSNGTAAAGLTGNISIKGDAVVEATGGDSGAGIGDAASRGSSLGMHDIRISGNAIVKATGGDGGAGIGGSKSGTLGGSSYISISEDANVVATGGIGGTGIGVHRNTNGPTIILDSTATLKAYSDGTYPAIYSTHNINGTGYFVNAMMNEPIGAADLVVYVPPVDDSSPISILNTLSLPENYRGFAYLTGASARNDNIRAFASDSGLLVGEVVRVFDNSQPIYSIKTMDGYNAHNGGANNNVLPVKLLVYTVTYKANGGTGADYVQATGLKAPGTFTTITLGESGFTAPSNAPFMGWNTQADGKGTRYSASQAGIPISGNMILFAEWSTQYDVTFNANGGEFANSDTTVTVTVMPATPPSVTKVGSNMPADPTRSDYIFLGWNTIGDGTGTWFDADTEVTGSLKVYAIWMQTITDFSKVSGGTFSRVGDPVVFTINFTLPSNLGGYNGLLIFDELPETLDYQSAAAKIIATSDIPLTVNENDGTVSVYISETVLQGNENKVVELVITAKVNSNWTSGNIANTAKVFAQSGTTVPDPATATPLAVDGAIVTPTDFRKTGTAVAYTPGGTLEYLIEFTLPAGIGGYDYITVKDTYANALEYSTYTMTVNNMPVTPTVVNAAGAVTFNLSTAGLNVGDTVALKVIFNVDESASGPIKNKAELFFDDEFGGSEETDEIAKTDFTKNALATSYTPGGSLTYQIDFTLPSDISDYDEMVIWDEYPSALTYDSYTLTVGGTTVTALVDDTTAGNVTFTVDLTALTLTAGDTV
ncbi:MAG: isopeptide-forming domain-containing fimbrial protein, partial [Methanimicrococcus sp.]|nr:isopeptide-forming domain-containing fimbrial protein [Methanimicrococcus sp.]